MANSKRWLNLLKLAAKILFSTAFLLLVLRKIHVRDLVDQFQKTNPGWILIALFFFVISKWISAIRLNHFFRNTGLHISESENTRLYWLGMYFNMFLPGGIGGDGYKIYILNRKFEIAVKKLFWAVFLDRVSGMVALVLLAGALSLTIFKAPLIWVAVIGVIAIGGFVYTWGYRRYFPAFLSSFYITNWQGLAVQFIQLVCAFCIIKAIGVDAHYKEYLLVFLVSSVVAIFPFTIGGLGAREITFLYGSQFFGLDQQVAVTISLWFYLITLVVSLVGLVFVFSSPFKSDTGKMVQHETP